MSLLTAEEIRIQKWLRSIPGASLKGRFFWRCIEKEFVFAVLQGGPNFYSSTRYNVKGEFSALYLSESRELARLEKTQGEDDFEPLVNIRFLFIGEVVVPDLSDTEVLSSMKRKLGIMPGDLVRVGLQAYDVTQRLARVAFHLALPGLLVPSAQRPTKRPVGWRNLVLFPATITGTWLRRQ